MIDFVRLRPKISDELPGEKLHLTCEFSIGTAKEDGTFNVVSTCSYGFTLDDEQNEDDFEIPAGESSVLVDSMSLQYVSGAEIDYVDDLQGSRFSIKNPQAQTTCGCGSSFNPY